MLIRLFQAFDSITLDSTAQPAYSHPPPEWKRAEGSRKAKETIWPKTHLTLYSNVGYLLVLGCGYALIRYTYRRAGCGHG